MAYPDGTEPIVTDELLYRRIPASQGWYDDTLEHSVSPQAFTPKKHDSSGISLWRGKYRSVREAAQGWPGKSYYVAVLRADDLRVHGVEVVPTAEEGDPGHASVPALNYADRHTDRVKEMAHLIATRLCRNVEGPFQTPEKPSEIGDE